MFAYTLFLPTRTNSPCFDIRYSCGCGRIARVYVYAILADTDESLMFACTLRCVRNRTNSSSFRVRIRADADEQTVFSNSPCLRVPKSCVSERIASVSCMLFLHMSTMSPCLREL